MNIVNINKYKLTFPKIKKLKVDRTKLNEDNGFWRNDVIKAWCISGSVGPYYDSTSYWLGVYDKPKKNGEVKIAVSFDCYSDMCSYDFKRFFNPEEIETEDDYIIQYKFIERMNELIEKGVFSIPQKEIIKK